MVRSFDNSWEGYLGSVWALNRDITKEGVLFRTMGSYGQYDYNSHPLASTRVSTAPQWQGDVMVGYQWVRQQFDLALYAGIDHINHNLSPARP